MSKNLRILASAAAAFFLCSAPSFAQIPLMVPGAPTSSAGYFPKLPYSAACKREAILGTWKLLGVYEVPAGPELADYAENPLQFYVFDANSLYGTYAGPLRDISAEDVKSMAISRNKGLQQFVVNSAGMIYFYKDSIAIDSLACFIVAQDSGPFATGQMLLMPPEHAAKSRMVKVYQRVWSQPDSSK